MNAACADISISTLKCWVVLFLLNPRSKHILLTKLRHCVVRLFFLLHKTRSYFPAWRTTRTLHTGVRMLQLFVSTESVNAIPQHRNVCDSSCSSHRDLNIGYHNIIYFKMFLSHRTSYLKVFPKETYSCNFLMYTTMFQYCAKCWLHTVLQQCFNRWTLHQPVDTETIDLYIIKQCGSRSVCGLVCLFVYVFVCLWTHIFVSFTHMGWHFCMWSPIGEVRMYRLFWNSSGGSWGYI